MYLKNLSEADTLSMFASPVSEEAVPGYHAVVRYPMDLSTIRKKLLENQYTKDADLEDDVARMITNALEFNDKDSEYYSLARDMRERYHEMAIESGLDVDADTAYIPTKRFRDDEGTLLKAEQKGVEDVKDVLDGLSKDQEISLEELRKKYKREALPTEDEEDEELESDDEESEDETSNSSEADFDSDDDDEEDEEDEDSS